MNSGWGNPIPSGGINYWNARINFLENTKYLRL
jgi:hypothetical protein